MRYINVSFILVFRLVSQKVNNRFPSLQSLIDAKLLLEHEAKRLQEIETRTPHEATWTPILWALKLIQRARTQNKIQIEAPVFASLVTSFDYVEQCNRTILNYGWVNFPLAYTQVATLSVFLYSMASLFSAQYLIPQDAAKDNTTFPDLNIHFSIVLPYIPHTPDVYFPFFTMIELLSYLGWIKVAEDLLNPFGDDDEDFQINYLIDRNLQVSYLIVDEAENQMEMSGDPFLEAGISVPSELPYNESHRDETSKTLEEQTDGNPPHHFRSSVQRKISRISSNWTGLTGHSANPTPRMRRRGEVKRSRSGVSESKSEVSEFRVDIDAESGNLPKSPDSGFSEPKSSPKLGNPEIVNRKMSKSMPTTPILMCVKEEREKSQESLEGHVNAGFEEEDEESDDSDDTQKTKM